MKSTTFLVIPFLALALAGCAQTGSAANDISPLAGVYSTAHPVTVNGVKLQTNGYMEIDRNGLITAFEQDGEGPASVGGGCLKFAAGTATNAGLQERMLAPGVSPRGDAVYQTLTADGDTFGILAKPSPSGNLKWFFHWARANNTVTIDGSRNVVNSGNRSSYSISGPALASPTPEQLRTMLCHADALETPPVTPNFVFHAAQPRAYAGPVASAPVAASAVSQSAIPASTDNSPSTLGAALPFEIAKSFGTNPFAGFGISPDSPKQKILREWAQSIVSDPDIQAYYHSANMDPATVKTAVLSRMVSLLDAMQRLSQEDREQLNALTTRALDNAPADCGGTKSLQVITSRYTSLETESDSELRAQLHALFDLVKLSTVNTPVPQITVAQRLQGQLALSTSISDALKRDPSEAGDLGLLMSGKPADLSPTAWCKATRFFRDAFDKTPQPERDWVMLAGIENQARLASSSLTLLKNFNAVRAPAQQPAAAPAVFDYADVVRQRVRSFIVWNGPLIHGETVVEVRCASTGLLESAKIVHSSGNRSWDKAALAAVMHADPMPLDQDGKAPRVFTITLRPNV
jgi:TonB family protein